MYARCCRVFSHPRAPRHRRVERTEDTQRRAFFSFASACGLFCCGVFFPFSFTQFYISSARDLSFLLTSTVYIIFLTDGEIKLDEKKRDEKRATFSLFSRRAVHRLCLRDAQPLSLPLFSLSLSTNSNYEQHKKENYWGCNHGLSMKKSNLNALPFFTP